LLAQLLGEEEKEIGQLYKNLLYLFLICWLVYPILFIVGHNGGVLEPSTYLEIVTVPLEIVAKGIAGIVVRPFLFGVHPL
jgi:bacteriorhodopsin